MRKCCHCNKEIINCMGFVIAGDLLLNLEDRKVKIRELCGKCVFIKEKEMYET